MCVDSLGFIMHHMFNLASDILTETTKMGALKSEKTSVV